MSSYQVSVEFDFNQESSDSDLSEKVLVKVRCLEESNALDSEPQGPYMIEPLADNWIAECSRKVHEAEQRNQA